MNKEVKQFVCPKCGGNAWFWGVSNGRVTPIKTGWCNSQPNFGCGFSWPRSEDDKCFKIVEPLYTIEQVVQMIRDEGLSIYNSGKDHQGIEFWPSLKETLAILQGKKI